MSGTGLGLNLCQKILRHLNSQLVIDSVFGEGTTARFTLEVREKEPVYYQPLHELELELPDSIDAKVNTEHI